ncbi:MAG: type II secretion system protein GspG [Candidatus Krumholzibacteriota bacterium]|nr:type II secretion system protein GspG [Candidatus Krumholzibacteriota bacterium]
MRARGFTLIEVIIAVAIVAIMAGAIAPVAFRQVARARHDATQQELGRIRAALEDYYEDTGAFPAEADGLGALVADPGVAGWQGPYLGSGASGDPLRAVRSDAFGENYVYDLAPSVTGAAVDLIVASPGINKRLELRRTGTWNLTAADTLDDIFVVLATAPLDRAKRRDTVEELDTLADAARAFYEDNGAFPTSLALLETQYLDAGFEQDAFLDGWRQGYRSRVEASGLQLVIWSIGPNHRNENGAGDDLALVVNSAPME